VQDFAERLVPEQFDWSISSAVESIPLEDWLDLPGMQLGRLRRSEPHFVGFGEALEVVRRQLVRLTEAS
jgi:hypothetical protein